VTALAFALLCGYGVFLLYTAVALNWTGLGVGPASTRRRPRIQSLEPWLVQSGLHDVRATEFLAVVAMLFAVGAALAFSLFGGLLPALAVGGFAASFPLASYRGRRVRRREAAREAWPAMIEEIRLLTGSLGRSVPQALFEVGLRGPVELRPAFAAAQREWLLSTDFERTVDILKALLADATADAACETLLVAHQVGGTELDRRLAALIEDRTADVHGRKDARARQAGVRFARRFTLVVPFGMALAGLSIGNGRDAYATAAGQLVASAGVGMVVVCWVWAGRIMQLPEEERVFGGATST
jgi:tight adherence protein B